MTASLPDADPASDGAPTAFDGYKHDEHGYDELFAERGEPRSHARGLIDGIESLGRDRLVAAGACAPAALDALRNPRRNAQATS